MAFTQKAEHGKRARVFHVAVVLAVILSCPAPCVRADSLVYLRVYDWKTGELYVETEARIGSKLSFGWIHSLEKIPWNEYYHIGENLDLILDAITFPAFGAGIPENKGSVCRVKDGLIYMEEIGQHFSEIVWLNSHTATQEIALDGKHVLKGDELPHHARLRLVIE
jgi:hypothetical protein